MTDSLTLLALSGSVLLSALVQTTVGFGSGLINVSLFPHFLPSYSFSIMLNSILGFATTVFIGLRLWKHIQWKLVWAPFCGYIIPCAAAIFYSVGQPDDILRRCLGVFLILISIWYWVFGSRVRVKPTNLKGFIAGAIGGVLGGLFGCGAPPIGVYFSSLDLDKYSYVATVQGYFMCSSSISLVMRIAAGMYSEGMSECIIVGIITVAAASWLGTRFLKKLDGQVLRKWVYIFIAANGVALL